MREIGWPPGEWREDHSTPAYSELVMENETSRWSREQVLIALNLYCQLPFGKLDEKTPVVIGVAKLLGRTPGALSMKLNNLAGLDPAITATGRVGLKGRSKLDEQVWADFRENPESTASQSQALMDSLVQGTPMAHLSSDHEVDIPAVTTEASTTSTATLKIRRGQAFFRRAVLASYDSRCCMSGLAIERLLVASHVKPWSVDEKNRLNPQNGLCLSALHDRAYDLGYISVRPNFTVAVSKAVLDDASRLSAAALAVLQDTEIRLPSKFKPDKKFLDWHYSTVFRC